MVVLRGRLLYLIFDEDGALQKSYDLPAGSVLDADGGGWHSFLALEADPVLFEVKPGPYPVDSDKEFAPWAPEEFSAEAAVYMGNLLDR
ncbi:MAG: WbuC family cupin fold metalloprotein [Pontiella sp.]